MRLCVIPARGGSKRIPRKNIKEFYGKPMIAWAIEVALNSRCFDNVLVSTDDEEIKTVAEQYSAEVPFMRPAGLADDYAGTISVVRHTIRWFDSRGQLPDIVCCLYPTAPFVTAESISTALHQLLKTESEFVFPVTRYPFPIQRAIWIDERRNVQMFDPKMFSKRSQDLNEAYHDAGQFYIGKATTWLKRDELFTSGSSVIVLPRYCVQDIDTVEDWQYAELMFAAQRTEYQKQ